MKRKKMNIIVKSTLIGCAFFIATIGGFFLFKNIKKVPDFGTKIELHKEKNKSDDQIDFNELKKINSDIYAWIRIKGTNINYPVLQAGKDKNTDFYLRKNINCQYDVYGSIYSQNYQNTDLSDFMTILYGHDSTKGKMFGDLKKYVDKDFAKKHNIINIITPTQKFKYKIFYVYENDSRLIPHPHGFFKEDEEKQIYITNLKNAPAKEGITNEYYYEDVTIDNNSKLLLLSTCTKSGRRRFIVEAIRINDK